MLPSTLHLTRTPESHLPLRGTSVVLSCPDKGLPIVSYWGPAFDLPPNEDSHGNLNVNRMEGSIRSHAHHAPLLRAQGAQILGAGVEAAETPSLMPTQAEAWTSSPLISIQRDGREIFPCFETTTIDVTQDAPAHTERRASDPGCAFSAETSAPAPGRHAGVTDGCHSAENTSAHVEQLSASGCIIYANDPHAELDLAIYLSIDANGLVSQSASLTNRGTTPLSVSRLWLSLPLPANAAELWTHTGHHLRERAPQRQPFTEGVFAKESWMGRPDFNATLLMSAGTPGFGWENGDARAVHLAWSGNSTHFAIRTPYSQGLIGAGELLHPGEIILQPGEHYDTPELVASWGSGMNEVSARYHARLRAQHPHFAERPRPVTLNTWEAVYFEHDEATMMELARRAAQIGVERFVIDDGWFKGRRNDTRALGDWQVDTQVWPRGLGPIAALVHELGMEFGLWFEPEMICLDSDIQRAHPEWVLRPTQGRLPLPGRDQYVLDLANLEVWEYLYSQISGLVRELGINYIKWDHNRWVSEAISPSTGRPAIHGQTRALYRLLDALRANHPELEIESCSSGGGRVDLGILARTDRVWASDCTDPLERIDIQRHTSLLVPPEMIGAHIAESPSHMTGRSTRLATRATVAFTGHLGIEWNILTMDEEQLEPLTRWIGLYKQARQSWGATPSERPEGRCADKQLGPERGQKAGSGRPKDTGSVLGGHLSRAARGARVIHADSTDPAVRVSGLLAPEGTWSLWRFAALGTSEHYPYGLIRLSGLEADALYRIRPFGGPDLYVSLRNPSCRTDLEWWTDEGIVVPGAVLSHWGVRPPHLLPGTAVLIEVERIS